MREKILNPEKYNELMEQVEKESKRRIDHSWDENWEQEELKQNKSKGRGMSM